jgi:hypothetical protein
MVIDDDVGHLHIGKALMTYMHGEYKDMEHSFLGVFWLVVVVYGPPQGVLKFCFCSVYLFSRLLY